MLASISLWLADKRNDPQWHLSVLLTAASVSILLLALREDMPADGAAAALGVVAAALSDSPGTLRTKLLSLPASVLVIAINATLVSLLPTDSWWQLPIVAGLAAMISLLAVFGTRATFWGNGVMLALSYTLASQAGSSLHYPAPLLIAGGAAWYALLSLSYHVIFPQVPVRDAMASAFDALADYVDAKAQALDPLYQDAQKQIFDRQMSALATLENARERVKEQLRSHSRNPSHQRWWLLLRAFADVHQRLQATHVPYQQLRQQFRYSSTPYDIRRLLEAQANDLRRLGAQIRWQQSQGFNSASQRALAFLRQQPQMQQGGLLYLLKNLTSTQQLIQQCRDSLNMPAKQLPLINEDPNTFFGALTGGKDRFSWQSPLVRHSARLAITLSLGLLIGQLLSLTAPYWIVLTIMLVLRPSYGETATRLQHRIWGTVAGVSVGLLVLQLFPSEQQQLALLLVFSLAGFSMLKRDYAIASFHITGYVLLLMALAMGNSSAMAWPRLVDTLIGAALCWFAIRYLFPSWQFKRIPQLLPQAYADHRAYFAAISALIRGYPVRASALRKHRRQAYLALSRILTTAQALNREPSSKRRHQRSLQLFARYQESLLASCAVLVSHSQLLADDTLPFEPLLAHIQQGFNQLAVKSSPPPIAVAQLNDDQQLLKEQLYNIALMQRQLQQLIALDKQLGR